MLWFSVIALFPPITPLHFVFMCVCVMAYKFVDWLFFGLFSAGLEHSINDAEETTSAPDVPLAQPQLRSHAFYTHVH